MLRRVIRVMLLGTAVLAGGEQARADRAERKPARVAAADAARRNDPALESRQHRFAPMREGDRRSFTITGREGKRSTAATLVERVTSLSVRGDRLRAEVAATWVATGGRAWNGYSARRIEEVDRDGVVRATNRLDRAPIPGSVIEGVALPRDLRLGRSWTVALSYRQGGRDVTARIRLRVAQVTRRRAPDGRVRPAVVIEWREVRSTAGARRRAAERWTGRSVYLEGVGEIETRMQRVGSSAWFERRLASFQPG